MKKILLIAATLLSMQTFAQKGNWYLGGVAGFGSNTHKDYGLTTVKTVNSSWAFGPEFGTFLKDDIQLGAVIGLGGGTTKVDGDKTVSYTSFNPTIYCRKFFPVTDNFSMFAGLYLNYLSGKSTNYGPTSDTKFTSSGFGARVGVGIAYALSPRVTAVGQYGLFGFTSTTSKDNDGNKTDSDSGFDFGVNTIGAGSFTQGNGSGSVFNIGIYYTIVKKN